MNASARRLPVLADVSSLEERHVSQRPTNRADCRDGERPCPWVSCRYHLALDIKKSGRVRVLINMERANADTPTCALDLADDGEQTLETIGDAFDMSRERVRQILLAVFKRKDASFRAAALAAPEGMLPERLKNSADRSGVVYEPREGTCQSCGAKFTHHAERGPVPDRCPKHRADGDRMRVNARMRNARRRARHRRKRR